MMVLASQEARASETNRFSADDREYLGRTQTLLASRKGHSKLEFHPATVTALEDILPTVYVVAEGNDWLFNVSEIYWLLYGYRWWNGDFAFEGYVDCAAASALWFEQQEQLDSLIQDSVAVASAVAQVDNAMCVIQGTPLRMCLDFFISAKTAGPLNGDNRGFDTSAPYEASRVQVYLDLNSDSARVYLSPSSTWVPIMNGSIPTIIPPAAPYNHGAKSFQVTTIDATTKVVSFEFYNGYCSQVPLIACPAIDGLIKFSKGPDGNWTPIDVQRDQFPSLQINREESGSFHEIWSSPENHWWDLITRHQTIEKWRQQMGLPPGCHLE